MVKETPKGLLDMVGADPNQISNQIPPMPSEHYMPGMGLGASRDAIRWAYKGYCVEMLAFYAEITAKHKKTTGRKALGEYACIDCRRALMIWFYVRREPERLSGLSNRALIGEMHKMGAGYPKLRKLFPLGNSRLEASVSTGKTKLEMGEDWTSKVCEKLWDHLS